MPRRHTNKPHHRFTPKIPCAHKRGFKTEAEALRALELTSLNDLKVTLYAYQCSYCPKWHLSSGSVAES